MPRSDVVAIVGGGPAGAFAAAALARHGRKVVLFDEKLAWEKPCGGGVTHKALSQYPFLQDAAVQRKMIGACQFISPAGRRTTVELEKPIAIFSRRVLNGMLLDRAASCGAEVRRDRVTSIQRENSHFVVGTKQDQVAADFVVLAAGARNPFRAQFYKPFEPADLMATVGYYIPGSDDTMQIRFLNGVDGYIWTFPRFDHYSAGICGRMADVPTAQLRLQLEAFLRQEGLSLENAQVYAHVLPAPRTKTWRELRVQGDGWAMVGDCAGFVDPVTGEGLYYALRSGDLLAEALITGRPHKYESMARHDFLADLTEGSRYAERFFHGTFMGESILERMIQFADESPSFRTLLSDLFSGAQGYANLRSRCYRTLPHTVWDFVATVGGWRRAAGLTGQTA